MPRSAAGFLYSFIPCQERIKKGRVRFVMRSWPCIMAICCNIGNRGSEPVMKRFQS